MYVKTTATTNYSVFLEHSVYSELTCLSVEATKGKLEDMEDDVKTLKRRHANSIKVVIALVLLNERYSAALW